MEYHENSRKLPCGCTIVTSCQYDSLCGIGTIPGSEKMRIDHDQRCLANHDVSTKSMTIAFSPSTPTYTPSNTLTTSVSSLSTSPTEYPPDIYGIGF